MTGTAATPKDHFPCDKCGKLFHIDDLDAKPLPENEPDHEGVTDWERFECRECYGPGFVSNREGAE